MHHAWDNARRNNRLKGEVKRDLLFNNNDVRDKSDLWLVTEIHNQNLEKKTHDFKNNKAKLQTGSYFEVKT